MRLNYEVYVQVGGRWSLESCLTGDRRDDAIADAKAYSRIPSITATKVVEEVYDERTRTSREQTIFSTRPQRLRVSPKVAAQAVAELPTIDNFIKPAPGRPKLGKLGKADLFRPNLVGHTALPDHAFALMSKVIAILSTSFGFATLTTLLYVRSMS